MKKLANLKGTKVLNKLQQKSINGGDKYCPNGNSIVSVGCINGHKIVICRGVIVAYLPCF